jgi:hypothetical protein
LFHSGLSAVEKIRHRYGCENSSEKSRHTWRKDEAETQSGGAPGRHAIWARNQMTDAALKSTAAWFLFYFARAGAANVIHKRCAQNGGDSVLGDDTQLMRGYSQQREIKLAEFSRQAVCSAAMAVSTTEVAT